MRSRNIDKIIDNIISGIDNDSKGGRLHWTQLPNLAIEKDAPACPIRKLPPCARAESPFRSRMRRRFPAGALQRATTAWSK